jgi:hypothetical protein
VTPLTAGEAAIKIQCFWLRWRCALVCKQLGMMMVGHKVRRKEEGRMGERQEGKNTETRKDGRQQRAHE